MNTQVDMSSLLQKLIAHIDVAALIRDRRYLHQHPELSGQEYETSLFLKKRMEKLGYRIHPVAGTGFIATYQSQTPGPKLAFRSDIDALPIEEKSSLLNGQPRPVCSQQAGVMHACGHDGHMAIQLELARLLMEARDELCGEILFIFEEGEEIGCGIAAMLEALKSFSPDAIYGTHLYTGLDCGQIACRKGPVMAGSMRFELEVKGKAGHSSRPDLAISPIFAAAEIISGLGSRYLNVNHPEHAVTLGISTLHGGTAFNVIPEMVEATGTLRFYHRDIAEHAAQEYIRCAEATAKAQGAQATCRFVPIFDPVVNNEKLAESFAQALPKLCPELNLDQDLRWFASESFSRYCELAPCLFTFTGARNIKEGCFAEHHHAQFEIDERALRHGVIAALTFLFAQHAEGN